MSLTLDFSADPEAVWDNPEAITLGSNSPVVGDTAVTVPTALRTLLTKRELAASNGAYTGLDRKWWLPGRLLPGGLAVKPRDVVTDGQGVAWTVLEAAYEGLDRVWELTCRDLVLVHELRDLVTIQLADASTADAAAGTLRRWPPDYGATLHADLPCRVQPQESAMQDARGLRGQEVRYTVYLSRQLDGRFDARECRVLWDPRPGQVGYGSGGQKILDVERYTTAEQIAELPRLECRLKAGG